MDFHEHANLFPLLTPLEASTLTDDIKANGLVHPIVLHEGKVLDGRNRYLSCSQLGIKFDTVNFQGKDTLSFVLSENLHRRHLTESQRASVAGKIANMRQGDRTDLEPYANLHKVSRAAAAKMLNVSVRSVSDAVKVQKKATPEVVTAVDDGYMSVSHAAKVADLSPQKQRVIVKEIEKDPTAHVSHNSGDNEWYTPKEYIASASIMLATLKEVLNGGMDKTP